MKAVNLLPSDSRRGKIGVGTPLGPGFAAIAVLAVALALVTLYVVTSNTIAERKAKLAEVRAQTAQQQALASRLAHYAAFAKLAQQRAQNVRQIAAGRFDWHGALSALSKVFPDQTSLSSLSGTASPSATVSGAGGSSVGGSSSSLRAYGSGPAFELSGCTSTQDDVAGLMSRLRVMPGVTRVTLGDSVSASTSSGGGPAPSSGGSSGGQDCPAGRPGFDLLVFYKPLPGAAAALSADGTPAGPAAASPGTGGAANTTTTATTATTASTSTPATSSGSATP